MRHLRRIIIALIASILLAALALVVTGNKHVLNGITKTYLIGKGKPDIDDMEYFATSTIKADKPEPWPIHSKYNLSVIPSTFMASVDSMQTTALLVFKNDSLLFEQYWNGYDVNTKSNSFSMAKSFCAMLIGKAIDEGYIKSLDQPVGDFIPEFSEGKNSMLTIKHLLQMTSGIPFGESYGSPFGYMAKAYYGDDLVNETMKYRVEREPGTFWIYEGGNSVLLGMILKKATGRTPSEYFFQKVWSCIGAENDAHWNLDHEGGLEKTFSGFYATARDFARLGKLYEHEGVWETDTVIPTDFAKLCVAPNMIIDSSGEPCTWYGMHWWLGKYMGNDFFSCRGMRGQYIAVVPGEQLIVVRLGHNQRPERVDHMPPDLYMYLDIATAIVGAHE
ncbi:MAG: serine hydrolase domain-containing protein [Flavobacteriales bacterium]